jgi:YD repeat-containing protein
VLGQAIGSVDGDGNLTQTQYDAAGNVAAVIDPDGNMTSYVTDALGRTIVTTDALGNNRRAGPRRATLPSATPFRHCGPP